MQTRLPAGVPLDDLFHGVRYELVIRGGPRLGGKFARLLLERGRPPRVVITLAGGREKILWVDDIESIHRDDEDGSEPLPPDDQEDFLA
jgi:hypothetical protein